MYLRFSPDSPDFKNRMYSMGLNVNNLIFATTGADPAVQVNFDDSTHNVSTWGYLEQNVRWDRSLNAVSICLRFRITSMTSNGLVPLLSYTVPSCFSELQLGKYKSILK
ncbi:hypothetical protein SK128_010057 [Halocaridina rubra]|uniref:Uncharacterized protein n=1 Tax=Halocaridina rubra TaxID=373956 RepID=A0AAN9A7D4_HALRR